MASVNVHDTNEHKDLRDTFPDKPTIIDIPEELEPSTCSIRRVPDKLREINPAAYTPRLVSIGPLHHGDQNLKAMEHQKIKYQQQFLKRDFCKHITVDDMLSFMLDLERDHQLCIQHCYAVTFEYVNWSDFSRMIVRDACFIFELFLRNYEILLYHNFKQNNAHQVELPHEDIIKHSEDYILRTTWLKAAITEDLILLENQLPYFVLTKLFDFIFQNPKEEIKLPNYLAAELEESKRLHFFLKITLEFFDDYCRYGKPRAVKMILDKKKREKEKSKSKYKITTILTKHNKDEDSEPNINILAEDLFSDKEKQRFKDIKHFTHLVREIMRSDKVFPEDKSEGSTRCFYGAKQLDSAGVTFVLCEENKFLADIHKNDERTSICKYVHQKFWKLWKLWNYFELNIPELSIQDDTECILRNVMAFEQFVYPEQPYICSYIFLLDQLVSTVEDMDFLVDKKIIDNWLGSNKAAVRMVNKLCDQIVIPHLLFSDLCQQLNRHHDNPWNVFKATLKRNYLKDIWTMSSSFVALALLIFSLFSTYSTIKNLFF